MGEVISSIDGRGSECIGRLKLDRVGVYLLTIDGLDMQSAHKGFKSTFGHGHKALDDKHTIFEYLLHCYIAVFFPERISRWECRDPGARPD